MIDRIIFYYSYYPSVRYATIALLLISLCTALLGVVLVLKRMSMIGDSLSHICFGAASIATAAGLVTPIYISLPITVISSVLMVRLESQRKVSGDAAIAMMSAASLAFGYLILNLFPSENSAISDACANLFGAGILSIDMADVVICAILSLAILALYIVFYNRIFTVAFDENFASATGTRTTLYNTLVAVFVGVAVVVAMNIVGALLVSALIVFPALSSMRIFKTFKSVTFFAAAISTICSILGLWISLCLTTPVGSTIVIVDMIAYGICCLIGGIREQ